MSNPKRILRTNRWNQKLWKAIGKAAKAEGMGTAAFLEKAFVLYHGEVSKMTKAERDKKEAEVRRFLQSIEQDNTE